MEPIKKTADIKNVLTVAGMDPSGGAGILADVKVMSALGAFATSVVAALTAQNTCAVTDVLPVPAAFVKAQIRTLFEDVRIDAVKIGMLGSVDVMQAVAEELREFKPRYVVLDTVMVAKSGARLMPDDSVDYFRRELLPLATVITPNLPEAEVLLNRTIRDQGEMQQAARDLYALSGNCAAVYFKGGHFDGEEACDVLFDGTDFTVFTSPRTHTKNTHGTGCSLSSAIATKLAQTDDLVASCREAKSYISDAIAAADMLSVGQGHGPIHHFIRQWS